MNWLLFGVGLGISLIGLILTVFLDWMGVGVVVLGLFICGYARRGTWIN